ncbi:MAG: hypothetical protein HQL28_01820 [Candidatus Omnitrophica bacterium]|nr:hypothetical protein [Candidatus Omnitrophota bacterium]
MMKIQLDMLEGSISREKLYYRIGKDVSEQLLAGKKELEGLEKYREELQRLKSDNEHHKEEMDAVKKPKSKTL